MHALLRFAGVAVVVCVTTDYAVAADSSGYGVYRSFVDESPKLNCAPYSAVSSSTGWTCNTDPDERGLVVSKLVDTQCIPSRVSLSYFYTTSAGVRKSIPSALVYQCKDGALDGSFEQRRAIFSGASNTQEGIEIERGKYAGGKRTGTWTFNGVSETGQPTLYTATYKDDRPVGVIRRTEAGKVTALECASRVPTSSPQFWIVKLEKATPERVALAERAALACEDWSTATCEDFKQQGLFGNDVSCQCDAQCSRAGTCTLVHGQCVAPQSETDCVKSAACRTRGKCGFDGSTCVVTGKNDCARSTGCADSGLCTDKDDECVAVTDKGCAASLVCRQEKRCRADGFECVVGEARVSQTCMGEACAEGQGVSGEGVSRQNDEPVVLGERRSSALYGLGIAITIVGGGAVLGGVGGFVAYKELTGEDPTTVQKVAFTTTAALGAGALFFVGLPMMRAYGERVPVKSPKGLTVSIQPVIGPTWVGLHGRF